jgi:hypothetical protein
MRPLLVLALLSALLGAAASPLRADWLILVGGKKIATEGPWSLKGDLLTVHETSGRILTVATSTVDAAACLKANAGNLHIQVIPIAPAPGSPLSKPRIAPAASPAPAPAVPAADAGRAARPAADASSHPAAKPAAAPAAGAPAAGAPAAAGPVAKAKAPEEQAAAHKLSARQAQLLRDQRHQQIVDGCARMFVVDRAGYDRCVQTQTQAAPPPR